jgi:hypothetical protein
MIAYCTKSYPARKLSPERMKRKGCEDAKKQRRGRCKWLLSLAKGGCDVTSARH